MNDTNILSRLPGEYVATAAQSLPVAETACNTFRDAAIQLPDGHTVVITFRRLSHKHGRSRHWFWSAIKAVPAGSAAVTSDDS